VRGSFQETAPRKAAENTVEPRDGGVGSVVDNHRGGGKGSVVVTTLIKSMNKQSMLIDSQGTAIFFDQRSC